MTNHVIPIYIVSELMLQCTNGVGFDPAEGRTILQQKKKLSTSNTVSCEMFYPLGSTNKLFPESMDEQNRNIISFFVASTAELISFRHGQELSSGNR